MRLIIIWLFDLASNFRLHIAALSLTALVLEIIFIDIWVLKLLILFALLFSIFPLSSWIKSHEGILGTSGSMYKVESFNIEWNATEHENSLQYIKNSDADILVLQEVTQELKHKISDYSEKYPYQLGEGHSHVMVLSKFNLQLVEYLPWPGKYHKRAMHVICQLPEQVLHIIAIHLQVTRNWREIQIRNHQIDTLSDYVNNIKQALMVVGDFNAGTGSNVLRQIENTTALTSNESLLTYKRTWPAKAGICGIQLDHFYVNNKLTIDASSLGPILDSDHRPISTNLRNL